MADEIKKDEILSEEELDKVAGGTVQQTASDLQFLRDSGAVEGLLGHEFGNIVVGNNFNSYSKLVAKAWNKVGITCKANADGNNVYMKGDEVINRWQAYGEVRKMTGFPFKPTNYGFSTNDTSVLELVGE